jgi:hypothetical protein
VSGKVPGSLRREAAVLRFVPSLRCGHCTDAGLRECRGVWLAGSRSTGKSITCLIIPPRTGPTEAEPADVIATPSADS